MNDENWRERLIAAARHDLETRARLAREGVLFDGYHPEMAALHAENAALVEHAIEALSAWPTRKHVGDDGASAAFLIAQHAIGLPAFQRRALSLMLEAAGEGEINIVDTAYLADRIAVFEGRAQTFGTQFDWDAHGQLSPAPIADPTNIEDRRASVGLPPLADVIAEMRAHAAAEGETPPADLAQRREKFEAWAKLVGWRA